MLLELQSRLAALVATAPLLAGHTVLVEAKGDLANEVAEALAKLSLAVIVAEAEGEAATESDALQARARESLTVEIIRASTAAPEVPVPIAVVDQIIPRVHGALLNPSAPRSGLRFAFLRHELREYADGDAGRIVTFTAPAVWPSVY